MIVYTTKELYNEWYVLKYKLGCIAAITQNENLEVTQEEILRWNQGIDDFMDDVKKLQLRTLSIIK